MLQILVLQPPPEPELCLRRVHGAHLLVCRQFHSSSWPSKFFLPLLNDDFPYLIPRLFPLQFFVAGVILLTSTVVSIAYWIGLPYWWETNRPITIVLLIVGNWLLLNVSFHYYKAVVTPPGVSPGGSLIASAVSICKKCIAPKAARVHHCSVCNTCILKMDHHCRKFNLLI